MCLIEKSTCPCFLGTGCLFTTGMIFHTQDNVKVVNFSKYLPISVLSSCFHGGRGKSEEFPLLSGQRPEMPHFCIAEAPRCCFTTWNWEGILRPPPNAVLPFVAFRSKKSKTKLQLKSLQVLQRACCC